MTRNMSISDMQINLEFDRKDLARLEKEILKTDKWGYSSITNMKMKINNLKDRIHFQEQRIKGVK